MVHLHHVSVEYPRTKTLALYDVNLEVKKGEFVFLTGHSGAGKSTLLGLILRRVAPSNGTVHVDGQDLAGIRGNRLAQYRRKTGMVFQDHRLLEDYTVEENLSFVLRVQGVIKGEWENRIGRVLRTVGLAHKKRAYPYQLSMGEAQRVAIARAVIGDPLVLLADEPTGNLDEGNALAILEVFRALHARGTTMLIATHSHELIEAYPQRVVEIRNGQVIRGA
jgi:cell division transport system ATP-binding protein